VAAKPGQKPPMELIGHVTSSYCEQRARPFDCLGAGSQAGRARLGQTLYVPPARGRSRGRSHRTGFLRSGRSAHQCLNLRYAECLNPRYAASRRCRRANG